jgi:hypothetical protein
VGQCKLRNCVNCKRCLNQKRHKTKLGYICNKLFSIKPTNRLCFNKQTDVSALGTSHIIHKVQQSEMKPEWWGSPLVHDKYQEEKTHDKRQQ